MVSQINAIQSQFFQVNLITPVPNCWLLQFPLSSSFTFRRAAMEFSLYNSSSLRFPQNDFLPLHNRSTLGSFHTFSIKKLASKSISTCRPLIWRRLPLVRRNAQTATESNASGDKHGEDDFIVEDVPHLTHFLPDLPVISEIL